MEAKSLGRRQGFEDYNGRRGHVDYGYVVLTNRASSNVYISDPWTRCMHSSYSIATFISRLVTPLGRIVGEFARRHPAFTYIVSPAACLFMIFN